MSKVVAVDLDRRTVQVVEDHVLEGCKYNVANDDTLRDEYLFRSPYIDWRKSYVDSPTLFAVVDQELATKIAVQVLGRAGTSLGGDFRFLGASGSTITLVDTETWHTVSTTEAGCEVTHFNAGPRLLVVMCASGELVGLSE